ncbi:MAG: hypothetical protein AVDCRST_MAG19-1465, partial [uncultured Thermomicrobiales bacterium]
WESWRQDGAERPTIATEPRRARRRLGSLGTSAAPVLYVPIAGRANASPSSHGACPPCRSLPGAFRWETGDGTSTS